MIFFTSDTHFNGEHILIRESRPFKNAKHFAKYVVRLWNKQSGKNDMIYHLGDFANFTKADKTSWEKGLKYVRKIKAKVVLIIGNSEERIISNLFNNSFDEFRKYCLKLGFHDVKTEGNVTLGDYDLFLNHYPRKHKKDKLNLFGHTHRAIGLWTPYGLNVCCDLNHFYLFSETEILRLLGDKTQYWDKNTDILCMDKIKAYIDNQP